MPVPWGVLPEGGESGRTGRRRPACSRRRLAAPIAESTAARLKKLKPVPIRTSVRAPSSQPVSSAAIVPASLPAPEQLLHPDAGPVALNGALDHGTGDSTRMQVLLRDEGWTELPDD